MTSEHQIVLTAVERQMVKRIGQALDSRRINPDMATFTASDIARAIRFETGARVNHLEIGALLDRMGVPASRRDYRRQMAELTNALPEWMDAANMERGSVIRTPIPSVRESAR